MVVAQLQATLFWTKDRLRQMFLQIFFLQGFPFNLPLLFTVRCSRFPKTKCIMFRNTFQQVVLRLSLKTIPSEIKRSETNLFWDALRITICSSMTVSLFLCRKPSHSYSTYIKLPSQSVKLIFSNTWSAKCLTKKAVCDSRGFAKCSHFLHLSYSLSTQDLSDPLGTWYTAHCTPLATPDMSLPCTPRPARPAPPACSLSGQCKAGCRKNLSSSTQFLPENTQSACCTYFYEVC